MDLDDRLEALEIVGIAKRLLNLNEQFVLVESSRGVRLKEIAEDLGLSAGRVRQILQTAYSKIRKARQPCTKAERAMFRALQKEIDRRWAVRQYRPPSNQAALRENMNGIFARIQQGEKIA